MSIGFRRLKIKAIPLLILCAFMACSCVNCTCTCTLYLVPLLFHSNRCFANVLQCCVTRTLRVFFKVIHDHALMIHYEEYVHQVHIQQTQQRFHFDGVSLCTAYQHVTQHKKVTNILCFNINFKLLFKALT